MSDFSTLIDTIHDIQDRAELEDFLLAMTTPKERLELVRRVDIVLSLLNGTPQQLIAKELGVGVATVTRGSKELALGRFLTLRKQANTSAWQASNISGSRL